MNWMNQFDWKPKGFLGVFKRHVCRSNNKKIFCMSTGERTTKKDLKPMWKQCSIYFLIDKRVTKPTKVLHLYWMKSVAWTKETWWKCSIENNELLFNWLVLKRKSNATEKPSFSFPLPVLRSIPLFYVDFSASQWSFNWIFIFITIHIEVHKHTHTHSVYAQKINSLIVVLQQFCTSNNQKSEGKIFHIFTSIQSSLVNFPQT